MLRTRENSDVFNTLDEIYLVFTSKKVNILFLLTNNGLITIASAMVIYVSNLPWARVRFGPVPLASC